MSSFGQMLLDMNPGSTSEVAWQSYGDAIRRWISTSSAKVVLEVGGGRSPLLSSEEATALGVARYLVNDVSAAELDHLDADRERACFDIQDGPPADADYAGQCDLVFAHMVFEHVAKPAEAWASVARLLRPGGIGVSFHPVLYSPPFVANRLIPERLSRVVLERAFPRRNDDDHPKFPAYYRWCRASEGYMTRKLAPFGFASVEVRPFYGHEYFNRIPVLRTVDNGLSSLAQRRTWPALASYAYVIVTR